MGKRLSILSLPIVQEEYSVPRFDSHEREIYFSFNEAELDAVKHFHSHRNRIHFLLMLGYFKIKPICLIYRGSTHLAAKCHITPARPRLTWPIELDAL